MSQADCRALFQKIIDIFNSGDTTEVEELFSPTYLDHQKPSDWTSEGPEEFKQIVLLARKHLPNLQVTIEDSIAEGERVAARLLWRSRVPTGKLLERETVEIIRFSNGRAAEHWGAELWAREQEMPYTSQP